jgi:hypothetical protein
VEPSNLGAKSQGRPTPPPLAAGGGYTPPQKGGSYPVLGVLGAGGVGAKQAKYEILPHYGFV